MYVPCRTANKSGINSTYLPHTPVRRRHVCLARLGLRTIDIFYASILEERGRSVSHCIQYTSYNNSSDGSPISGCLPSPCPLLRNCYDELNSPKPDAVQDAFDSLFPSNINGTFKASCLGLYSLAGNAIVELQTGTPLEVHSRPMGRS